MHPPIIDRLPAATLQRRRLLGLGGALAAGALGAPLLGSLLGSLSSPGAAGRSRRLQGPGLPFLLRRQ